MNYILGNKGCQPQRFHDPKSGGYPGLRLCFGTRLDKTRHLHHESLKKYEQVPRKREEQVPRKREQKTPPDYLLAGFLGAFPIIEKFSR